MEQISIIFASAYLIPLFESNPTGAMLFIALVALVIKRRKP